MEKIEEIIKNFGGLKYKSAIFNISLRKLNITFLYSDEIFDMANEVKLRETIKAALPYDIEVSIDLNKSVMDTNIIANKLYMEIKNNYLALAKFLDVSDISVTGEGGTQISVKILLPTNILDYANQSDKCTSICNFLENNFFCRPTLQFFDKGSAVDEDSIAKNREYASSISTPEQNLMYNISDKINVLGQNNYSTAINFCVVKEPMKDTVICGNIKHIEKKSYKKQLKKEDRVEERPFYTINLVLDNKYMYASVFVQEKDVASMDGLQVGANVAMKGYFKEYMGKMSFVANEICLCTFNMQKDTLKYKTVNNDYHIITPNEYAEPKQIDLFYTESTLDYSKVQGTYVIFDLETTGLDSQVNEIVEIGAVKMVDGKITNTFDTLIKPQIPIAPEVSAKNNITNDMLCDCHSIESVIPDFYKFCEGATIVAHNIDFDYGFIKKIARKMLYNFDHPQIDTLRLSRQKIKGVPNYKLGTLAVNFGIELIDAHRALNDAIATAKVFINLMQL